MRALNFKSLAPKILLTLALLVLAVSLGLNHRFYDEALTDAFFGAALVSVLVLHFRVRPNWKDAAIVPFLAFLLAAVDFRVLHYRPRFMAWLSFLGLASFLVLAVRTVWESNPKRKQLLFAWVPALLFVLSDYFASSMLEWTAAVHPKTLDLYLFSFDSSLRVQLSFAAGRLFATWPTLRATALIPYIALAIPIAVVYSGQLLRSREKAIPAMLAFLLTGPLGILFYNLFPACGPHYVFHAFPANPLPLDQVTRLLLEPIAIEGPRNAIPSLHMAWMLLAWWYSRGLSLIERLLVFAFLGFTALATLGTGEHWFIDLIVAVPFALAIEALCAYPVPWRNSRRWSAFLVGSAGTLGWFAMLRFAPRLFWISPVVPWALAAATIGVACVREARLASVQPAAAEPGRLALGPVGDHVIGPLSNRPARIN